MQADICMQAKLSQIHSNAAHLVPNDEPPVSSEEFVGRIQNMIMRRQKKLESEKFVFFSMREDEQEHIYVSWPVSGYMPISAGMIFHDLKVQKACTRLKGRHHIKNIQVIGKVVSQSSYFDWIQ